MATRYIWKKQDVQYSAGSWVLGSAYVGSKSIYAGSGYSFNAETGLYTLTNAQLITVDALKEKSYNRYFIIGGSVGKTIYDNASHSLPGDTYSEYSSSSIFAPSVYEERTISKLYELQKTQIGTTTSSSGATIPKYQYEYVPVKSENGKQVYATVTGPSDDVDYGGYYDITSYRNYTVTQDYTLSSSSSYAVKGGGEYSSTVSVSTTYRYCISNGYISYSSDSDSYSGSIGTACAFNTMSANATGSGTESYITSRNSDEYPTNGADGAYWYKKEGSDEIDPILLTVTDNGDGKFKPDETVTYKVTESTASTLRSYGSIEYVYYYSVDGGATWTTFSTLSTIVNTVTIPSDAITFLAGVKIKDNLGFEGDIITATDIALTLNMPPIISDMDRDLGTFEDFDERPGFTYTVQDEDTEEVQLTDDDGNVYISNEPTDTVTVTEYIDSIKIKQYQFKGIIENDFKISDYNWLTMANGEHKLKVVATDGKNTTTRTYTFTKAVYTLTAEFETPFSSSTEMYLAMEEMTAEVPNGAEMWIYVTNNGYDGDETVWQDVTSEVLGHDKIYIPNTRCISGTWGYNVKIIIKRGTAKGSVWLESCSGHYRKVGDKDIV